MKGITVAKDDVPVPKNACVECGKTETRICASCRCARYCSEKCQRKSWLKHKTLCKTIASLAAEEETKNQVVHQRGNICELSPVTKGKVAKLVGDKCNVQLYLDGTKTSMLWDTGSQVSIVGRD